MGIGKPRLRREIEDRLLTTTLVVEADLDQCVLWTRPEDLELNLEEPLRGLGGFRDYIEKGFLDLKADGTVMVTPVSNDVESILHDLAVPPRRR